MLSCGRDPPAMTPAVLATYKHIRSNRMEQRRLVRRKSLFDLPKTAASRPSMWAPSFDEFGTYVPNGALPGPPWPFLTLASPRNLDS
jgi:hypothetical protein